MPHPSLTVPEKVSFEQAIAITQTFLSLLGTQELTEPDIEITVRELVESQNGARGFFVTYLTDEQPFGDRPSSGIIKGLQSSPDIVSELLVKNIAMSTAMAITHQRNNNLEMAQSSQRVRSRTANLIEKIALSEVSDRAQQLYESAKTGAGTYQSFLERWGYDAEQKQAIQTVLAPLVTSESSQ